MAEDCLLVALCAYVDCAEDIPIPSKMKKGQELVTVPPLSAAKLALYSAMRRKEISKAELAQLLGIGRIGGKADADARSLLPHEAGGEGTGCCRLPSGR